MALEHEDKQRIIEGALERLRQKIDRMAQMAEETRQAAVHEESRPEDDKDTRGLEASYLARGQAQRVADLRDDLVSLRFMDLSRYGDDTPIGLSALVELEGEEGERSLVLLVPRAGGLEIEHEGRLIRLITPVSPLGRALVDRVKGDDLELRIKGAARELLIVDVV